MTIWHLFLAKIISCRHTSSTLCEDNDHEQGLSFTCFCTPPGPTPSGFYWGQKCSWILTSANSMQASSIQSDGRNMKQPDLKQGLNLPTSPNLCATNWSLAIWSSTYLATRWILCYFKTFLFVFGLMAADLIATGTMKHIKKPLKSGEIILQCSPVTTSLTESVLSSVTRCWKINVAQKIDTTVFT